MSPPLKTLAWFKGSAKITLGICGVVAVFISLVATTVEGFSIQYVLWIILGCTVIAGGMLLQEAVRRRRHRTLIRGRRLRWLTQEHGLNPENLGSYWGYKGSYASYFIRIYYDWDNPVGDHPHALSFVVYYAPVLLTNGKPDIKRLDGMNQTLNPKLKWWQSRRKVSRRVETAFLIHSIGYHSSLERKEIRAALDQAIEAVRSFGLTPITEEAVSELVTEDPYLHGLDIETFRAAFPIR